ncbi:hypothetical protein LCGC14_2751620 [marine sediment metagenome]|uniref:Uncharacterized protein n=1 Tax=marine sediment metagenome TaxID=412755 RepID=A0A0F9BA70_9ZZZZ
MLFWLVILGAWMGWVEAVYDKPRDIPADIPERYLRNIPYEPCPPAVEEAERVVRSGR